MFEQLGSEQHQLCLHLCPVPPQKPHLPALASTSNYLALHSPCLPTYLAAACRPRSTCWSSWWLYQR